MQARPLLPSVPSSLLCMEGRKEGRNEAARLDKRDHFVGWPTLTTR